MSKYDTGLELINNIMKQNEIIDNNEGVLSVADLINIMDERFKEFWDLFYGNGNGTLSKIKRAFSFYYLKGVFPFFHSDCYELKLKGENDSFSLYQEKDDLFDFYYNNVPIKTINSLKDDIYYLFKMMRAYDDYGVYLTYDPESRTEKSFRYGEFCGSIIFYPYKKCDCYLTFSNIDRSYQQANWSNNRMPLSSLLDLYSKEIIKRIPVDVNKVENDDLFKKAYFESKSFDMPKNYTYVK